MFPVGIEQLEQFLAMWAAYEPQLSALVNR